MRDLSIIPECYIDTNLVETLINGCEVNHQKGCGTVTKKMKDNFRDDFALGILDKDKKDVDYIKEFTEISKTDHLILYKHPVKNHYIIQIVPAMEKFILHCMSSVELKVSDFGLPEDFEKFKKKSKTVNSKDDITYKKLFKNLVNKNASQILLLKNWINYLRNNKFNASVDELKKFN